jgi:hypothetical protein
VDLNGTGYEGVRLDSNALQQFKLADFCVTRCEVMDWVSYSSLSGTVAALVNLLFPVR